MASLSAATASSYRLSDASVAPLVAERDCVLLLQAKRLIDDLERLLWLADEAEIVSQGGVEIRVRRR